MHSYLISFSTIADSLNAKDGLLEYASLECDQAHMLEQVKTKAHALVLNAIGFQAAESVRWTKTLLTDLWEGRLRGDDDSMSDNMSVLTSPSCFSGFSNGNSSVDSCPPTDPELCTKSWRRSRRPLSRCLVPKSITTSNDDKEKRGRVSDKLVDREGKIAKGSDQSSFSHAIQGWQHSIVYQLVAFLCLFAMSFQFLKMKEFCHSMFKLNFRPSTVHHQQLVREPSVSAPKGVSFHRVITSFPENAEFLLYFEQQESWCAATDQYGANDCHFEWNDDVKGNFVAKFPQILDEQSSFHADLILEGHIPYHIDCAMCGQPCKLELPLIHFEYDLAMPDCPVDLSNSFFSDFDYQLWKHSPSEGLVTVSLEGTATVYSSPGQELAQFQVSGSIR